MISEIGAIRTCTHLIVVVLHLIIAVLRLIRTRISREPPVITVLVFDQRCQAKVRQLVRPRWLRRLYHLGDWHPYVSGKGMKIDNFAILLVRQPVLLTNEIDKGMDTRKRLVRMSLVEPQDNLIHTLLYANNI